MAEHFQPSWTYQVSYVCPPLAIVPLFLSMFLVKLVIGQFRLLILVAPILVEAPWLPKVLNMLEDIPDQCRIIRNLIMNVSVDRVLKGLQSLHLGF